MMSAAFRYDVFCLAGMLGDDKDARRDDFLVDMWVTEVVTNEMLTRSTLLRPCLAFRLSLLQLPTCRRESRIFGCFHFIPAFPVPCMTAGVGRQQTACRDSFFSMFIMVHGECVVLYGFSLTTSMGRDEAR